MVTSSSSSSSSTPSPRRPSKFIESLPSTNHILQDSSENPPPTPTNELFFSILEEMDEFEVRRQQLRIRNRGTSQSSTDSLPSNTSSAGSNPSSPSSSSRPVDRSHTVKEGNRRSINFTRRSLDKELALGGGEERQRRRSGSGNGSAEEEDHGGDSKLAKKFVGRLRALTGGRREDGRRS